MMVMGAFALLPPANVKNSIDQNIFLCRPFHHHSQPSGWLSLLATYMHRQMSLPYLSIHMLRNISTPVWPDGRRQQDSHFLVSIGLWCPQEINDARGEKPCHTPLGVGLRWLGVWGKARVCKDAETGRMLCIPLGKWQNLHSAR
jgi:hypothetical protein